MIVWIILYLNIGVVLGITAAVKFYEDIQTSIFVTFFWPIYYLNKGEQGFRNYQRRRRERNTGR
jgi:hypothetical protein